MAAQQPNRNMQKKPIYQSQLQRRVVDVIETIIPPTDIASPIGYTNYVDCKPSFLRSPRGGRLEIDIWIPGLPLAVEVQGEQHYRWVRSFFPKKADWDYYISCDNTKKETFWRMNCPFLQIHYKDEISVSNIAGKLRELCQRYPTEVVARLRTLLDRIGE